LNVESLRFIKKQIFQRHSTFYIHPSTKKMIIDTLQNASKYYSAHPLFTKAFEFITKTDLVNADDGKSDIVDGLKVIISKAPGKTKEASLAKFECHNKNIDIQFCINGLETIGWKPREKCINPNGDYNAEKDVQFFHDEPDTFFQLTDGQFAIFFPEDVHAPMIGEGVINKLVIKVRI
jgi:YhcH/YjgK/YiaL family protein